MSTNIDQSLDDIIKLTQKKQAPRGKGAANRAGGARKTKQQIVQKQVIRQQQQQKRSKLSIPKGRLARQGQRGRIQAAAATSKRLSSTPVPRQSAVGSRGRSGRGRPGGIAARLQQVQQANNQGGLAANRRRRGALNAQIGRGGGVAKKRVNRATLSVKKALATVQASRQAGRAAIGPQTRASGASEHSNPSNDFPLPSNVQISVGDSGYSRQVDTEPVGIDIGAFSIHTTSQTLNSRFTAIEELAVGSRSPSVPPPHSTRGGFNRKLRVVGRGSGGRGQGEGVMGQGGRGRGRGQGRR